MSLPPALRPAPTGPLRVLLADDEEAARVTLAELLAGAPDVELVGAAEDGAEALRLVRDLRPDLLLLDVQMPGLSGLDVLRRLDAEAGEPAVVLATAFDEHAVTAYELGALDYLLKPFGRERLLRAVERAARRRPAAAEPGAAVADRARWASGLGDGPLERLFVHDRGRIVPVGVEEVVRIEGEDDYAAVYTVRGGPHLVGLTLREFERRLDPAAFVRVHRSHLVALAHVHEIAPHDGRRLALRMADGATVVASRTATPLLRRLPL